MSSALIPVSFASGISNSITSPTCTLYEIFLFFPSTKTFPFSISFYTITLDKSSRFFTIYASKRTLSKSTTNFSTIHPPIFRFRDRSHDEIFFVLRPVPKTKFFSLRDLSPKRNYSSAMRSYSTKWSSSYDFL